MMGNAYKLLVDNGLMDLSPQFTASVVLVCAGTALLFFSLSGFLVRMAKLIPSLYLRGLAPFTVQQLASRVNTAFASLTVVCMVLFLALTSVCGGLGLRDATESSLSKGTPYGMSVTSYLSGVYAMDEVASPYISYAASLDYNMVEGLEQSLRTVGKPDAADALAAANKVQLDVYWDQNAPITYADVEQAAGFKLTDKVDNKELGDAYGQMPLYLLKLSQLNAALELAGKPQLQLGAGECAVVYDMDMMTPFWEAAANEAPSVSVAGCSLKLSHALDACLQTTPVPMNSGMLVVADADLPQGVLPARSILNIACQDDAAADGLREALSSVQLSDNPDTWPVDMNISRIDCYQQNVVISTIVGYLAIYLGIVLVIACAAILSIQQLSEASDNAQRYGLLRKLGAPEGMLSRVLFAQVLVYFLLPLLLAVAHSACAMYVVADVVDALKNGSKVHDSLFWQPAEPVEGMLTDPAPAAYYVRVEGIAPAVAEAIYGKGHVVEEHFDGCSYFVDSADDKALAEAARKVEAMGGSVKLVLRRLPEDA